ncbi:MAG: response regulator, partial [Chitinophagaceae bacterium]|nr:response regulator [Rubrivivax sp.]
MTTVLRVALLGFSAFERSAIGSYFRLAARRTPSYELVATPDDSDFIVADADHAASVQLVVALERLDDTVFIGQQAPAGATAWMGRPIDTLHVMRELDALGSAQSSPPPAPVPAPI